MAQKLASAVRQLKRVAVGSLCTTALFFRYLEVSLACEEQSCTCNGEWCYHFVLH